MQLYRKRFQELTTEELYRIIKLRVAVFVVEQNCPYRELDDLDQEALHLWYADEDGIAAYLRVLAPGVESAYPALGRVISARRRIGLGTALLREGIRAAEEAFGADALYLEAQTYAIPFYEKSGFRVASGEFLIDGIPHVQMLRNASMLQKSE